MKKIIATLATAILAVSCMSFVGCSHTCEFSADWSKDATNHWHACTIEGCTLTADSGAHTYENGVCTVCEYAHAEHTNENGACSVCGNVDHAFYQVSDETWASTFAFGDGYVLVQTETREADKGVDVVTTTNFSLEKGVESKYQAKDDQGNVIMENSMFVEFDNQNGKIYQYQPVYNPTYTEILGHAKEEIPVPLETYKQIFLTQNVLGEELGKKSNYTYNDETKAYEAQTITEGEGQFATVYKNASIKFENNALKSIAYQMEEDYMGETAIVNVTATLTRTTPTITFPAPYEANSELSETEFANLFKMKENMTQMQLQEYEDGSTYNFVGMIASNGMYTNTSVYNDLGEPEYAGISYFEFDQANDKIYRYEGDAVNGYEKVDFPMPLSVYMNYLSLEEGELTVLSNYTYNPTVGLYTADSIVDGSQTYTNVIVKVTDGKLEYMSYEGVEDGVAYEYMASYTYGDTVVNLPTNVA